MALDIYFRHDIANILQATACASEGAAAMVMELVGEGDERVLKAYRQGQRHALVSVALGFGLELELELEPVEASEARGASPALLFAESPREN